MEVKTMKEYFEKRKSTLTSEMQKRSQELDNIKARLDALEKTVNESDNEDEQKAASEELDQLKARKEELEAEIAPLQEELDEVNAKIAELDQPADPQENNQRKLNFMKREERGTMTKEKLEQMEKRAKEFVETRKTQITLEETRAVLVSSGTLATPTEVSGINEVSGTVSSIVDMVNVQNCEGMGANRVAYEVTKTQAGKTAEGAAYHDGETTYNYVDIKPETITVVTYISRQAMKQSPLKYRENVTNNAKIALRREASKYIINKLKASNLCVALPLNAINENTLSEVMLSYGGEDEVVGHATMLLNKATLRSFAKVRGSNEKKAVYKITPDASNPNTGIIEGDGLVTKYCLNSTLADGVLIYGQAIKFELDLFSPYEVRVSEDYKIVEGMLTIVGDVDLGGEVVFKDGFIVATVGAAA